MFLLVFIGLLGVSFFYFVGGISLLLQVLWGVIAFPFGILGAISNQIQGKGFKQQFMKGHERNRRLLDDTEHIYNDYCERKYNVPASGTKDKNGIPYL